MNKFWVVWNPTGNKPNVRHPDKYKAEDEARRLALAHPGQQFIVLEALCQYQTNAVTRTDFVDRSPKRDDVW